MSERRPGGGAVSSNGNRALLDTFGTIGVARQAKADNTLVFEYPHMSVAPVTFRSLALMAICDGDAADLTSLESF